MSRVAILPHFGDPFVLHYWLKWFRRVWKDEVDALCIISSNILNEEHHKAIMNLVASAADEFKTELGEPKQIYFYSSYRPIQHGDGINLGLFLSQEDLVMLVEEDTVIFGRGHVDAAFQRIESGEVDAVGSGRCSCSNEIIAAADIIFPDSLEANQGRDGGPNFWPNFFFAKRSDLEHTDRNFNARAWSKPDYIKELRLHVEDNLVSDTFGWASIQLRALGLRFGYVPQYHGHPSDLDDFQKHLNVFDGVAGWVHHGSLSGWRSLIDPKVIKTDGVAMQEIARRLAWYRTFVDVWTGQLPELLPEHQQAYREGIGRWQAMYEVPENEIGKRQLIYQKLMGAV